MFKLTRGWALALIISCAFFSCQKQIDAPANNSIATSNSANNSTDCGTPLTKNLIDQGGVQQMGTMDVSNDANNIYVKLTAKAGTVFTRIAYVAGSGSHVMDGFTLPDYNYTACNGPKSPDQILTYNFSENKTMITITLPSSLFQTDNCVWMGFNVSTRNTDGTGLLCGSVEEYDQIFGSAQYQSGFKYCRQSCPPPPGDCGQLRTQTPGGWGAPPSGNNSGAYLHKNFSTAFNNLLTVGCYPGNYYVKLTSAQAITNLLPTGGQAAKLKSNYTNPASIKNVLVGHMVAVTLAVGFDDYDANFGKAGVSLGSMIIKSGTFAGKSVSEFLAIGNNVLGGCSSQYSIHQVLETATAINENYVNGKTDKGYLVCPTTD